MDGSRRAIAAAFLANLGITLAKLVGFAVTGAVSRGWASSSTPGGRS